MGFTLNRMTLLALTLLGWNSNRRRDRGAREYFPFSLKKKIWTDRGGESGTAGGWSDSRKRDHSLARGNLRAGRVYHA